MLLNKVRLACGAGGLLPVHYCSFCSSFQTPSSRCASFPPPFFLSKYGGPAEEALPVLYSFSTITTISLLKLYMLYRDKCTAEASVAFEDKLAFEAKLS